jgi:hypothetical protein
VSPSDLAVVIPIVTAAISFFAAVIAVVVGQALGQKSQRQADERRWEREDKLRRRTRSEEMARDAITTLSRAADVLGWTAGYARGEAEKGKRQWVAPESGEVSSFCEPVRRDALEIDDDTVRTHLEKSCDLLPNSPHLENRGGGHPARVAWAVETTSEALVSAYLRGVALPDPLPDAQAKAFKVFASAYSAMEGMWAELDEDDDD